MMALMAHLMQQQQAASQNQLMMSQNRPPESLQMPTVQKTQDVDWTEKQAQLASKMKAEYSLAQNKRKTVTDTIHTSPLLDDEEPKTTLVS
jgi:hypothetical protein